MTTRRKSRAAVGYSNPFRTASYRRKMDAADDEFFAQQARKRAEAEAQQDATQAKEQNENNGDPKNG